MEYACGIPPFDSRVCFDNSKISSTNIMKRFPIFLALLIGMFLFVAADGCSSDPNVEGAKLNLRNKNYDRALENLDIAISKNPNNAEAFELKGRVLSEQAFATPDVSEHTSLIEQMLEAYQRAMELDPALSETVTMAFRIAYQSEFQRGIQAFNRGKTRESEYNSSATYFENASIIMPDSAGAYVNLAYSLWSAGRPNEAMVPFELAIEKGETEIDSYRRLASLYQENDRAGDAVDLLETASALYPDDDDLRIELLNAYQYAGQIDRAMTMYESAIVSNPDNKLFRFNYGTLLVTAERFDEAFVHLLRAIELDPDYSNAHYNLGALYVNQAVANNEEINALDERLRENKDNLSDQQKQEIDSEIMRLAGVRTDLFSQAIIPLEKAKILFDAAGEDAFEVCGALFTAYVQTGETEKAEGVSACAGFDDTSGN